MVTVHDLTYLRFPEMVTAASARYRDLVPRVLRRGRSSAPSSPPSPPRSPPSTAAPDRLVVTPLGIDPSSGPRSPLPTRPGWPPTPPGRYLLFVGNREPPQSLATLLAAYRTSWLALGLETARRWG